MTSVLSKKCKNNLKKFIIKLLDCIIDMIMHDCYITMVAIFSLFFFEMGIKEIEESQVQFYVFLVHWHLAVVISSNNTHY